jgi:hypothetical protein
MMRLVMFATRGTVAAQELVPEAVPEPWAVLPGNPSYGLADGV